MVHEEAMDAKSVSHIHAELYKYTAEQHARQRALHCHVLGVEITDLFQTSPGGGWFLICIKPSWTSRTSIPQKQTHQMSFTGQLLLLIAYVCKCVQHSECTENRHQLHRIEVGKLYLDGKENFKKRCNRDVLKTVTE